MGGEFEVLSGVPHGVEQATHLRERGSAGLLHVLQCFTVLAHARRHPMPDGADLEHHDAHGVGHDVVQLPGDPGPLLGHGDACGRLALSFGLGGALLGSVRLLGPFMKRESDQPARRRRSPG